MIGPLMLLGLVMVGVCVAVWERETVVLDFPPEEQRRCFIVGRDPTVSFGGVDLSGVVVSIQISADTRQIRAAFEEAGREFAKLASAMGAAAREIEKIGER